MPDLEKVIEGLKELRSHFHALAGIASSRQGRANHIESARTIDDAITLLEKQEPKVLALDDIQSFDGAVLVEYTGTFGNPMFEWLLYQVQHNQYVMFSNHNRSNIVFDANDYGKGWRCWTSRPTYAQMEATAWKT